MPSEYPSKQEMKDRGSESTAPERPSATDSQAHLPALRRTVLSAQVQKLAMALGKDAEELAQKIDPDTIRRTKYPVIEGRNAHGLRTFTHDLGITEGRRGTSR